MGVAQPRARRQAAWLAGVALVVLLKVLEQLLSLAASLAAASAGALEAFRQRVGKWRAAASISAAARARAAGRWRAMFEVAPLAMAKVSTDGRLEAVNTALCSLLGEPERALAGRRLSALVYPDDLPLLAGAGHPGRPGRGPAKAEVRLVCAGGRLRWCELASHLVRDLDGSPEYVLTSVVDITRHKRSEAALRDLATRDPLTGVANRRWFELDLAQHLRSITTSGARGAVLVADIDRFKQVNDTLGHQAGDRLVMEVAMTMRRHLRDQDLVARLGGDEFAVVLHDGDAGAAEAVARKLVRAVRDEVRVAGEASRGGARGGQGALEHGDDGYCTPVTVSIGVAPLEHFVVAGSPSPSAPDLIRAADQAMYLVKKSGRDGYALAQGFSSGRSRLRTPPSAGAVDLRGTVRGTR